MTFVLSMGTLGFWRVFLYSYSIYALLGCCVTIFLSIATITLAIWQLLLRKIPILIKIGCLLLILYLFFFVNLLAGSIFENYRGFSSVEFSGLQNAKRLKNFIGMYVAETKTYPSSANWFECLLKYGTLHGLNSIPFYSSDDGKSGVVYNEQIGNTIPEKSKANIVVVFEASHDNKYRGMELLNRPIQKDRYFLFNWQRYRYVLFADGTIVKYRLSDQAVSIYDPNTDHMFSKYFKPDETPYSPLKWK